MQTSKLIYGNCCVLSPDGILMFRCNTKKVNWYLSRELASIVLNDPLTIKLNFIPNGMGNHQKAYGLTEMKNLCVNCGSGVDLTRHHVVPLCYRRYFPLEMKSHNFHDVLSMCVSCHEIYERKADELKKHLDERYNAPINGEITSNKLDKYVKIAKTLLNTEIKLPIKRRSALVNKIKDHFGIKRLTKIRLRKISNINHITGRITHGEVVINKIDDIQSFIEMWRKHFIENNDCKYLPKKWDIKNKLN